MRWSVLLAIPLALACGQPQAEGARGTSTEYVPARPDGPVLDAADILPPEVEAQLDDRLRAWFDETDNALVVVSVTSLENRSIEKFAFDTFNTWGIGDSETDRGLLLLIAPNERMVRIEVGCGFEKVITNDIAAAIIADDILPHMRKGDLAAGTLGGVKALTATTDARISLAGIPSSPICKEAKAA
ncbi:TPM domain-containing protein [Paraurantiacibacter namhicola]|uniref:TPM domain-containing protein n=1 Tax=Paraurantiacibacter namhicola TaxID=645517 RepID=A0A1C7DA75_9SPHN|nr:TPM domain-containing protein [Paraurantiacibacter namhicola]ANU08399.1 hypothetical protein A6F65_02113 [Paraurantiacibacter namhicola]